MENNVHEALEHSRSIGESKGHESVLIVPKFCPQSSLPFIFFIPNSVVFRAQIWLSEHLGMLQLLNALLLEG
jgi:hypothetical protein